MASYDVAGALFAWPYWMAQESAPKGGEGEALTLPKTAGDLVFLIGPVLLGATDDGLGAAGASLGEAVLVDRRFSQPTPRLLSALETKS